MATTYPAKIDNSTSLPTVIDNASPVQGLTVNRLRDAILAIEDELGVKPSSVYGTVRARLDALEFALNSLQIIKLNEDLGGTLDNPLVIGLQGRPLSDVTPGFNQVLSWNGIAWVPRTISGGTGGSQDLAITLGLGNSADGYLITNLGDPVSAQDAATKNYVDTHTFAPPNLKAVLSTDNITDGYDIIVSAGDKITITDPPLLSTDAVNKGYVDTWDGYGFRSGSFVVPAVLATPGWNVTGAFVMPSTENVKLHAVGCVSDASLTMNLRVFRFSGGTLDVVPSLVVQITSLTDISVFSGSVSLTSGSYQYQTEVIGSSGDGYFGSLQFATLMKG